MPCRKDKKMQQIKKKIASNPVKGKYLKVELVHSLPKTSIRVTNIKPDLDEDVLKKYFNSHRMSGGGDVESLKKVTETEAIITFANPEMVQSVLGKQHKTLGLSTKVEEIYPTYSASSQIDKQILLDPLQITIDPIIAQFINNNRSGLEKSVIDLHVTFKVHVDEKQGFISFCPTTKTNKNWQEDCNERLRQYIDKELAREEADIPNEGAGKIFGFCLERERQNSVTTVTVNDGKGLIIAGEQDVVHEVVRMIEGMQVIDYTISLSPEQFVFFEGKKSQLPQTLVFIFEPSACKVLVRGSKREVEGFYASYTSFVQCKSVPLFLDPIATEFLCSETGKEQLKQFLQSFPNIQCKVTPYYNLHPQPTCCFLCEQQDADSVQSIAHSMAHYVKTTSITVPSSLNPVLPSLDDFKQLCVELPGVLIKKRDISICVTGFTTYVDQAFSKIQYFLNEKSSHQLFTEIKVSLLVARSLNHNGQGLSKLLQSCPMTVGVDDNRGIVTLKSNHYLPPGWEDEYRGLVLQHIEENLKEETLKVPVQAYQDVMACLYSVQAEDSTFQYQYPPQSPAVYLVGTNSVVEGVKDKIAHICTSYSFTTEIITLKPEQFEFFNYFYSDYINEKARLVNVNIDLQPELITISGTVKDVKSLQKQLKSLTSHESVTVALDHALVKHFSSQGRSTLDAFLSQKHAKCIAFFSESPMQLKLLCEQKNKSTIVKLSDNLKESVSVQSISVHDNVVPILPQLPDFAKQCNTLKQKHKISILRSGKVIQVCGFQEDVAAGEEVLSNYLKQTMTHFQPIQFQLDPLIAQCIHENKLRLQQFMESKNLQVVISNDHSGKAAAIISPTLQSEHGWKGTSQQLLETHIDSMYVMKKIQIPAIAIPAVYQIVTSQPKTQFRIDGTILVVAGNIKTVEEIEYKINDFCNRNVTTTSITDLNSREYDFFVQIVMETLSSKVEIEFVSKSRSLFIKGTIREVTDLQNSINEVCKHSAIPVTLSPEMVEFLANNGKKELVTYMLNKGTTVAIHCSKPGSLELLCHTNMAQSVKQAVAELQKETSICIVKLPASMLKPSTNEEFLKHCQRLETQLSISIIIIDTQCQIVGFKEAVDQAKDSIDSFIKINCTISHSIKMKRGVWRLCCGPMSQKWKQEIESQCLFKELMLTPPSSVESQELTIVLKGEKSAVESVKRSIDHLIDSVITTAITLLYPDLKKFFTEENDRGKFFISNIEKIQGVCIEIVEIDDLDSESKFITKRAAKLCRECVAEVIDMKQIIIYTGDITEFRADVIVNAANEKLKHSGGLAAAIVEKGGQIIQQDSDRYVSHYGSLNTGDAILTREKGKLQCSALIHAVGPDWRSSPSKHKRQQLHKAIMNCLKEAQSYHSIAIPAISSGIYGCPKNECADILISATVQFLKKHRMNMNLQDINFVIDRDAVTHFVNALYAHLPQESIRTSGKPYSTSPAYQPQEVLESFPEDEQSDQSYNDFEVLTEDVDVPPDRIRVQQGSILDVEAEIYVNSTNGKLDLKGGAVSMILAKAAGPSLQAECSKKAPIDFGEVAITGAGNIRRCKHIIHVNCPTFDQAEGKAEKVLRSIIHKCMEKCDKKGVSTIVFPAIGTGNLNFPTDIAAFIMVDEIYNYLSTNKCKSLSLVYLIIYMEDMYLKFKQEVEKRKHTLPTSALPLTKQKEKNKKISATLQHSSVHSSKFDIGGSVSVSIVKGDITEEVVDVIVNTTDRAMKLSAGGVGKALLKKAGKELQAYLDDYKRRQMLVEEGKVLVTQPGKLRCKLVFHTMLEMCRKSSLTVLVTECATKAIAMNYNSIAFPAIGTGMQGLSPDDAAAGFIDALQQISSPHPLNVRILITQQNVYSGFVSAFTKHTTSWYQRAGRVMKSYIWPEQTSLEQEEMETDVDQDDECNTALVVFGETKEKVTAAEDDVNRLISKQFKTEEIEDQRISSISKNQERLLQAKARNLRISFTIDRSLASISLKGGAESIPSMKMEIEKILSEVAQEELKKEEAKRMHKYVQWKKVDASETVYLYNATANLEIESAYQAKQLNYTHHSDYEHFTIDFKQMLETNHKFFGTFRVRRTAENAETQLPVNWESMTDPASDDFTPLPIRVIDLQASSKDYKIVLAEFDKTMEQGKTYSSIIKIQRIQNPMLYRSYVAKKVHLDTHNPQDVTNEKLLFHGTKKDSLEPINKANFNRSYRGQNGTVYGQGCYFARDASYSHRYSVADDQGIHYMYLVRVLVGEYTKGQPTMLEPPNKPNADKRYDSVVDNTSNPGIFVTFHDHDVYPEYLITYK